MDVTPQANQPDTLPATLKATDATVPGKDTTNVRAKPTLPVIPQTSSASDKASEAPTPTPVPAVATATATAPAASTANKVVVPDFGLWIKDVGDRGRGVFAGRRIPVGQLVVKFGGPIYDRDTCPDFSEALQVGTNAWMWSSGGVDDIVNHSCNPNCGLWQINGDTYLICIRAIEVNEELSFDYSTSMVDEPWSLEQCCCNDSLCRGAVGNFLDLPDKLQRHYSSLGVLPEHTRTALASKRASEQKAAASATTAATVTPPTSATNRDDISTLSCGAAATVVASGDTAGSAYSKEAPSVLAAHS